ncbi:Fic family protein [Adlercreutzia sp. R7]|uniref:protein adenylyltransferase n=1 Tax=Adlercreutzia wanghongyangiae TaxID=3111451 RepID=A0ABU6IIF6_9ACTN|nr:Fic family protein [Adlercreutzia sp. R7]
MVLGNKLGISSDAELAREEERLTKKRALELFDGGLLDGSEAGTFASLARIHGHLFQDVYDFGGQMRRENISKGGFRFAPSLYLGEALSAIDRMPQTNIDEIIEKYVEMNVAHPFREGNGRSMRIWLDQMLKRSCGVVVDWSLIDREDYLLAMERSPVRDVEIKALLKGALTDRINDRQMYMKGIDASYRYEGYSTYTMDELV